MMNDEHSLLSRIKESLGEKILDAKVPMERRVYITVAPKDYKRTIRQLVKMGITHVSTITGLDTGKEIEILTHLFGSGSEITVKTMISRDRPRIDSITDVIPGADFYEREVYDLLGVHFKGHPNLKRLLLPDKWPADVYPLRKDFKPEKVKQ